MLSKSKQVPRKLLSQYGIFIGGGADFTSFKELNLRLIEAGRKPVDNVLIARPIGVWAKVDYIVLQAKYTRSLFYNPQRKDSVHTTFNTSRLEATIGAAFIENEKIESQFLLGWNYATSNLILSNNALPSQPSFPTLITTPQTPYATNLYCSSHNLVTEIKTVYKSKITPSLWTDIALHIGYIYPIPGNIINRVENNRWLVAGANAAVGNMPAIRGDCIYLYLLVGIAGRK